MFHDHDGELTYSAVCRQDDLPRDIMESFRVICGGLIKGFDRLGLEARFAPLNDVEVGGKRSQAAHRQESGEASCSTARYLLTLTSD